MAANLDDALTDAASENSRSVRGALLAAVPAEHQHLFLEAASAKAGWDALLAIYDDKSTASAHAALKEWSELRQKGGEAMTAWVHRVKELALQLKDYGTIHPEDSIVFTCLAGLSDEYRVTKEVLRYTPPKTVDALLAQLLIAESDHEQPSTSSAGAVLAGFRPQHNGARDRGSGQRGGSHARGGAGSSKPRLCFICQSPEHLKRDCPRLNEGPRPSDKGAGGGRKQGRVMLGFAMGCGLAVDSKALLFDTGASHHCVRDRSLLSDVQPLKEPLTLSTLSGVTEVRESGTLLLRNTNKRDMVLTNVLHTPAAPCNILSAGALAADQRLSTTLGRGRGVAEYANQWAFDMVCSGSTYVVEGAAPVPARSVPSLGGGAADAKGSEGLAAPAVAAAPPEDADLVHRRYAHAAHSSLAKLIGKGLVEGISVPAGSFEHQANSGAVCETCVTSKQTRAQHPSSGTRAAAPMELVHMDVMGPLPVAEGGERYVLAVVDDSSGVRAVEPLERKSDVAQAAVELLDMMERVSGKKTVALRTDNGTEFLSGELQQHLRSRNIRHELSAPYTPQQNGTAERLNRTLGERARAMLTDMQMDDSMWPFAMQAAAYVGNRSLSSGRAKTPWEHFTGRKPDVSHLRVFGCTAYVLKPPQKRESKLAARSDKGTFVGYTDNPRAWVVRLQDGRLVTSSDVVFDETPRKPAAQVAAGGGRRQGAESGSESDADEPGAPQQAAQQAAQQQTARQAQQAAPQQTAQQVQQAAQRAAGGRYRPSRRPSAYEKGGHSDVSIQWGRHGVKR